jgi:hypothetical protein
VVNEAFPRVKIDQLLKSADRAFADGYSVRFGRPLDGDGKADCALLGGRGSTLTALESKRKNVNLSVEEMQRNIARRGIG